MSKLNLWRAFFHIIKCKLFTIKASTQANIYTYSINTYTHICTWREISATGFQSSLSVVDVSWRWQRFIMARVTQTCPGNNPFNLARDKQHWADLHTKDTKLSILTRQIRENAKVLLLAGLWLLCKILALKIRPISGKWWWCTQCCLVLEFTLLCLKYNPSAPRRVKHYCIQLPGVKL